MARQKRLPKQRRKPKPQKWPTKITPAVATAELRSPPYKFEFAGSPLFSAGDIANLAASSSLPEPGAGLSEAERAALHESLSQELGKAFFSAHAAGNIMSNAPTELQRAVAFKRVAQSTRKLLVDLGCADILERLSRNQGGSAVASPASTVGDQAEDDVTGKILKLLREASDDLNLTLADKAERDAIRDRSAVIRELMREAPAGEKQSIIDTVQGLMRLVAIAEKAQSNTPLNKSAPGPRPNAFVDVLLDELVRHFYKSFGRLPNPKSDEDHDVWGGTDVEWFKAVLNHSVNPRVLPSSGGHPSETHRVKSIKRAIGMGLRDDSRFRKMVGGMTDWADATLASEFEKAKKRIRR